MKPFAVTMGDPAGIGPEITVKLADSQAAAAPFLVVGDASVLERTAASLGSTLRVRPIKTAAEFAAEPGILDVISVTDLPADLPIGEVSAMAGQAAYDYVHRAIGDALAGDIAGIVTAPLNKEAMRLAGLPYPGHTEILAEQSGTEDYTMMMASPELRVVLVTIHEALRRAIELIDQDAVLRVIRLAHAALARPGRAPRVGVAGLNPHAGENGLMGSEEIESIAPAIARARAEGIDASGPYPADTVFMRARNGDFDVVIAQYHDQGLIPFKYLGIDQGVNVTIGLPFVRTSVDHGTAFGIAGRGIADPGSLKVALELAADLAGRQ